MAVQVLTDSTSYIWKSVRDELNIGIVSLSVNFKDESYREVDIDNTSFYSMMAAKGIPMSSQPTIDEIYYAMRKVIEKGDSLLCVFISSDMSGTFSTAHVAKNMILEEFSNAEIEIVDSRSNCMQLGYAAIVAAREASLGKSLMEVKKAAEDNVKRSRFLFVPDTLEYLKKGGRIGGASALIGNLLKIIPILTVEAGKTSVLTKVRTKPKAIVTMIDKMMEDISEFGLGEIAVHHINCCKEAEKLAATIKDKLNVEVAICDIGPVIGVHVGPGALGIVYYTERNRI
ncbi:MAG: DegV family protein [Solirubrobacterales bacterium]